MSKKKKPTQGNSRATKKAIVMKAEKKLPIPMIIVTVAAIAVAVGLGLLMAPERDTIEPSVSRAPAVASSSQAGRVTYAASLFDDGKARYFQYADAMGGPTIKYFILKSTDGVIRAAFDACDVCWPEGKGYVQDGTAMVCRNCGRRFESVQVNEIQGGCNPAPLQRTIQGDQVVIRIDDLQKGQGYFNFSKKA